MTKNQRVSYQESADDRPELGTVTTSHYSHASGYVVCKVGWDDGHLSWIRSDLLTEIPS